jgi:hypothetical protein
LEYEDSLRERILLLNARSSYSKVQPYSLRYLCVLGASAVNIQE